MPIIDARVVLPDGASLPPDQAQRLADALGAIYRADPGQVWVTLQPLPASAYAENDAPGAPQPVFLRVLHADARDTATLAHEATALAAAAAQCLGRAADVVHIEFAPPGRGRMAFGGRLLQEAP